jgi:hypothetical protein
MIPRLRLAWRTRVYEWFQEGFDTEDLAAARRLLEKES